MLVKRTTDCSLPPEICMHHFAYDIMTWNCLLHYWPFVRGFHQSPVVRLTMMQSFDVFVKQCWCFVGQWKINTVYIFSHGLTHCLRLWGLYPWWLLLGLLSWYPICKSSHCNSFEDQAPILSSMGAWSANGCNLTDLHDRTPGLRSQWCPPGSHTRLVEILLIYCKKSQCLWRCWPGWADACSLSVCCTSMFRYCCFFHFRADSRFAPSQWETALLCNDVSHWLGARLESALRFIYAWSHRTEYIYSVRIWK